MEQILKGPTGKPKRIGLAHTLRLPHCLDSQLLTYTISGKGEENLGRLLEKTLGPTGSPVSLYAWLFPLVITLDVNADLPYPDRSIHTLTIFEQDLNCYELTVATSEAEQTDPRAYEMSREFVKECIEYVRYRCIEYGLVWHSTPATSEQVWPLN